MGKRTSHHVFRSGGLDVTRIKCRWFDSGHSAGNFVYAFNLLSARSEAKTKIKYIEIYLHVADQLCSSPWTLVIFKSSLADLISSEIQR